MDKTCTACGVLKALYEFPKCGVKGGVQRYRPTCKLCWRVLKNTPKKPRNKPTQAIQDKTPPSAPDTQENPSEWDTDNETEVFEPVSMSIYRAPLPDEDWEEEVVSMFGLIR